MGIAKRSDRESIAIVGGGMMGIVVAMKLAESGRYDVSLFEKEPHLGGLSSAYQWEDLIWDRFYHVILSTDSLLIELLRELGLEKELFWRETKTGFYGEGKLVSMSSTLDFITFPFMSLWQKFRMGLGILYGTQIKDPSKLDKIYVRTWLTHVFGRRVYERIWEPLLRSKLGDARERASAAFIWATITRLYGARSSGSKVEKMGHIHGGYHRILAAAEQRLRELGVNIKTQSPVQKLIHPSTPSSSHPLQLTTSENTASFDKVLFTIPCPEVLRLCEPGDEHPYWKRLRQVEYLGVACVLLVLSRQLSPYYVTNLLDKELPFTGIIEATNVVAPEELGGRHLVYLPKYMPPDDPLNHLDDAEMIALFLEKLKKVFPDLQDRDILHTQIFRERYVQPLQELGYLEHKIAMQTPLTGVYLVNTAMISNTTLNNNIVIFLAKKATENILNDSLGV